jgi:hypothetical protein
MVHNLELESITTYPPKSGDRNNKNKKENMSTTLELPEGSKATIQGKVIDGKNYLVVEVENEEQELKEGDFAIFWYYNTEDAIIAVYKRYDDDDGLYVDHNDSYWGNALKWDGTKEQYEKVLKVLRGEL